MYSVHGREGLENVNFLGKMIAARALWPSELFIYGLNQSFEKLNFFYKA